MNNNLKVLGKFLDQPILISKLNKSMPKILGVIGVTYFAKNSYDTYKITETPKEAGKDILKKGVVLSSTVFSALAAPYLAGKFFNRASIENLNIIKERNTKLLNNFLSKNNCSEICKNILNKAKDKILSLKDIKQLMEMLKTKKEKTLLNKLIPEPENIKAKDIFHEIGYLSVYGAIPVIGGIAGGVAADIVTKENLREKTPDKISEGVYQYLANIFMCNIGAGLALSTLEKMKISSKLARAAGMTAGIILTGIVGGSKIANIITRKLITPIFTDKKTKERTPELLDLGLHTDDIATVSLLSGLKWIEPSLPILYSVSGYRAGIGYRN